MLATLASYSKPGLIMALDTHCPNTVEHQKPLPKLAVARREGNDRETQEAETLVFFFTELAFMRHYHEVYIVMSTVSS